MKKFFSGFLVLCLSLALLTACGKDGQTGKTVAAGGLTFAKSYSEVYSALTDAQKAIADRDKSLNMTDGASDDPESGGKGDGEGEGTFYSGTNVQVAGVDEGDIVKTDGTYIYILRGSELIVMQADGADVTDVSNVFVQGASAFPYNMGYNPTGLVGALAYWSVHAIRTQYLKNPGPLVQA